LREIKVFLKAFSEVGDAAKITGNLGNRFEIMNIYFPS